MKRTEYERLKEQAAADYAANLQALERVWALAQKDEDVSLQNAAEENPPAERNGSARHGKRLGKGDLLRAVKDAINSLPLKFTTLDVFDNVAKQLRTPIARPSVKSVLIRLEKDGYVETVTRGIGRRPSIYRKHEK
jgi:hypothetical protein